MQINPSPITSQAPNLHMQLLTPRNSFKPLNQWFSTRGNFAPRDTWQCLETFLTVTALGEGLCSWHRVG